MTVAQLIIALSKYELDQKVYYMNASGDHFPIVEVSLFDPEAPHNVDNPLSITTDEFWGN